MSSKRKGGKRKERPTKRTCPSQTPAQMLTDQDLLETQVLEQQQLQAALNPSPSLTGGWASQPFYHDVTPLQITGVSTPAASLPSAQEVQVRTLAPYEQPIVPTVATPTEATWAPESIAAAEAARAHRSRRLLEEEEEWDPEEEEARGTIPPTVAGGTKRPRSQLLDTSRLAAALSPQELAALQAAEAQMGRSQKMMRSQIPQPRTVRYRACMYMLKQRMAFWKRIQGIQQIIRDLGYIVPRGQILPAYPRLDMNRIEVQAANHLAGRLLRQ